MCETKTHILIPEGEDNMCNTKRSKLAYTPNEAVVSSKMF